MFFLNQLLGFRYILFYSIWVSRLFRDKWVFFHDLQQSSVEQSPSTKLEREEDRTRYKEMFQKADKDKKGYVTEDDLKALLEPELGPEKWKSFW